MPKDVSVNHGLRPMSLMGALQQKGAKEFGDANHIDLIQKNVKKSGSGKAGIKAKTYGKDKTNVSIKAKGTGQAKIKGSK